MSGGAVSEACPVCYDDEGCECLHWMAYWLALNHEQRKAEELSIAQHALVSSGE